MLATYENHGVTFCYPDTWELNEERIGSQFCITVMSPETTFWSLTLFFDKPDPAWVLEASIETLKEEYDEIDVYEPAPENREEAVEARDVEFVCMELLNSAFFRAFLTPFCTALIFSQGTDHELTETRPYLDAITASLTIP